MRSREEVMRIKERFVPNTVLQLNYMHEETVVAPGERGIVDSVDDAGQIHVHWNSGSSLALIPGVDNFIIISKPDAEAGCSGV